MDYDVFISYSSKDKAIANAVCHVIETYGIRCWIAPRDIPPGTEYADVIANAIHSCRIYIIIFSQFSSISKWVKSELNLAMDEQLCIIPFRIDDTPLQGSNKLILNKIHWIDAYPSYEKKLDELAINVLNIIQQQNNEKEKSEHSNGRRTINHKMPKWRYIWCVLILLILGVAILSFKYIKIGETYFDYDFYGEKISISYSNDMQADALKDILDNMIYVQGGSFIMGATEKDKKYFVEQDKYSSSQVHVELDDFYISKCELTQHQWNNIIGNNIQLQQIDDKFPMYNISWNDCVKLIDTLTVLTGLQFAIPSEAQWEYAARGGNKSKDYLYSGSDAVEDVGWVSSLDNSLHKVGIMDGNELELCDMTGNVSEWCGDFFAEEYKEYNVKNPIGPKDGKLRVIRGGNICSEVYESKITTRQWANPNYPATYTGVRLVIIPK